MRACFILKWQINLGRIQWSNIYGKSLNNQVSVDKGEKKAEEDSGKRFMP